jgi:hypothetical protein
MAPDDATLPAVMRDRGYRQVAGFWIRDGTPLLPPARADPPPG